MFEIRSEPEIVFKNIKKLLQHYIIKNNISSLIVGLSGGIDSTICCSLAHEATIDLKNIKIIGRTIPIETNTSDETDRGLKAGESFCDECEEVDLTEMYHLIYQSFVGKSSRYIDSGKEEKIRRGNLKARIRMCYLFDLAHLNSGMVLSTDNLTELYLGFWTLHGDVGNYGMIQHLWKTEVYELAKFIEKKYSKLGLTDKSEAMKRAINAIPTDGLGITSSDFDQIGVKTYQEADQILIEYLNGHTSNESHPIIRRYINSEFKRNDPQNIAREKLFFKE